MLRKLGYRIAVDDLGAGYAALGALAPLEPEIVKLDMSLVRDIDRHADEAARRRPRSRRCAASSAASVVAEGVETEPNGGRASSAGIDLIQGYLLASRRAASLPSKL